MGRPKDQKRGRRPYTMSEEQKLKMSLAGILRAAEITRKKKEAVKRNGKL